MNRQEDFAALAALIWWWITDFASVCEQGRPCPLAGPSAEGIVTPPINGRHSGQKLGHEAEGERNHEQQAEPCENLQRLGRVDLIRIVSIETAQRRILASLRTHSSR